MAALEERLEFVENGTSSMSSSCLIELSHFEQALSKVKPSVSEQVSFCHDMLWPMTCCHANLSVHHCYTVTCFHPFLSFLLVTAKETLRGIVEEVLVKLMDHHASIVVCV